MAGNAGRVGPSGAAGLSPVPAGVGPLGLGLGAVGRRGTLYGVRVLLTVGLFYLGDTSAQLGEGSFGEELGEEGFVDFVYRACDFRDQLVGGFALLESEL